MKKLKLLDKCIYLINALVAVLLLLSYILPFVPPKNFSLLSVLSLSVPFLTLVNVFFFIYWLIKIRKQMILSLFVLVIGYISFGSVYKFSSSSGKAQFTNQTLSIMNYNVRLFNLYDWIPEKHVEDSISSFIKRKSPDVLCLQEYHPHKSIDLSYFKHKYEKLSGKKTKYGQAIFSKYPIINSGSVAFPNTSNNAIFADIVKNKDTIRVYNVHLQSLRIDTNVDKLKQEDSERLFKRIGESFKTQQFQTELFSLHKKQCHYKMIIAGDFNNTAFSYVYKKIKGELKDSFEEAGNGFGRTYDFKFFPVRIDFILTDPSFKIERFKTFDEKYSDHYPIMTHVSLH